MRWFESLVRKAGLRRWSGMIVGMFLLGLSGHTWASATCSGGGQSYTLAMPASVSVPRDAAVGTLLSGWVYSPAVTNWYNCTVSGSTNNGTGTLFEPLSQTKSGLTTTINGVNYTVFNTSVPGVGIAIAVKAYINGCGWQSFWSDLGTTSFTKNPGWAGGACNGGTPPVTNGGQAAAILVKTGPVTPGTTSGGTLFEAASYLSDTATIQPGMRVSFSLTPTAITVLSCLTPDLTVSMGSVPVSTFTGVGSVSKPVGFNVAVNNCPAGMTSIQYQFASASGVVNATQGVIALTSSSTATGIGLQLKGGSPSTALAYNQQYQLSSYNAATGGSYAIPLTAAYYQTASTVTPGTANAILTFTMTYQ